MMSGVAFDINAIDSQARRMIQSGQFEQAEALVRPYLASGRGPLALWKLLAAAIRPQGCIAETRAIQQMLVEQVPGDFATRFDLSETLLLLGEFERGWREYRHRYSLAHTTQIERKVQRPRWNGEPIPGKTLLIHDEQGYGDTFQFMRMVRWAKAKSGARVVLEINADTLPLARRMEGYDDLLERGSLPPAFDVHCEMMSLPMAMGLTLADLPGSTPYLTADPQRIAKWRQRLADLPRPLVALVWAGRPTHVNDANRSLHLDQLAPLAVPGVTFVSIQKGPAEAQAMSPPAGLPVIPLSSEIQDFEDTAAILSVVDLLVSVDSSPVHLAGALGRPAWVMLPMVPDWRWLLERSDTPWYPTLRLFRQKSRGNWCDVVDAMASELARF
ncbi:glycosyl transferase family 8 [Trinickia sp. NRRL B-1857]